MDGKGSVCLLSLGEWGWDSGSWPCLELVLGQRRVPALRHSGESFRKAGCELLSSDLHMSWVLKQAYSFTLLISLLLHSSSASQEIVIQGMKTLTSSVPTAPLVSTTTRVTPAAASPARVAMGSAAPWCPRQRRWCAITVPTASLVRPAACPVLMPWICKDSYYSKGFPGNFRYSGLV